MYSSAGISLLVSHHKLNAEFNLRPARPSPSIRSVRSKKCQPSFCCREQGGRRAAPWPGRGAEICLFVVFTLHGSAAPQLRAGVIPTRNWQINPVAAQYWALVSTRPLLGQNYASTRGLSLPAALAWAPPPGQRLASNLAVSFIQLLSVQLWGHYWYYWKHRRWRNFLLFYIILSHLSARFSNMKLTFLL